MKPEHDYREGETITLIANGGDRYKWSNGEN